MKLREAIKTNLKEAIVKFVLFLAASAILTLTIFGAYAIFTNTSESDCERKGGVTIRSVNRYVCVKLEVIK